MAAIRRILMAPLNAADWLLGSLFGGGGGGSALPPPDFEAHADAQVLGDHLTASRRRSETEMLVHQDAVRTVDKYLRAAPVARATVDLTGLSQPVRTALLDMSSAELDVLKGAGLSAIRRFVDQRDPEVHSVPTAVAAAPAQPAAVYLPMTAAERMAHKIRALQMKDQHSEPFEDPRIATRRR
jgi:hypothetical protein